MYETIVKLFTQCIKFALILGRQKLRYAIIIHFQCSLCDQNINCLSRQQSEPREPSLLLYRIPGNSVSIDVNVCDCHLFILYYLKKK